jgi:DNA polymerase
MDDLEWLRAQATHCTNCDLYRNATQVVFGEGRPGAPLMLVGEQPGDREDIEGEPFVGPAGALLDKGLTEAGIQRGDAYVTNAVKHFKFEQRGKRRIHKKPSAAEVKACRPWLDAEIDAVQPRLIVALGATAAQALFGAKFKVTERRGQLLEREREPWGMATVHPSSILRAPDGDARHAAYTAFVADLRVAATAIGA